MEDNRELIHITKQEVIVIMSCSKKQANRNMNTK